MIILGLSMSIDTRLKITATSAGEALEWDSRKHNVGALQPQPTKGAPELQYPPSSKTWTNNLLTEGLKASSLELL